MKQHQTYKTFEEFYPFYMSQHTSQTNRRLHIIGTLISLLCTCYAILTFQPMIILYGAMIGLGLAWIGHFVFERNKPDPFSNPMFGLRGDFKMFVEAITGKRRF